jgi:hypothetical protein
MEKVPLQSRSATVLSNVTSAAAKADAAADATRKRDTEKAPSCSMSLSSCRSAVKSLRECRKKWGEADDDCRVTTPPSNSVDWQATVRAEALTRRLRLKELCRGASVHAMQDSSMSSARTPM